MSVLHNVNLEQVKIKLYERLKPSGWADKLKIFILSEDFDKILNILLEEAKSGKRFTPILKQVFRAFEECPYDETKVIILGQDPYPQQYEGLNVADGIAFSCSNTSKAEASLRYMLIEVNDTIYKKAKILNYTDLKIWSNQGVLIINSAFTTTIGKIGQHYHIWEPFLTFLFDTLSCNNKDLIYVFMGKKAQEWIDSTPNEELVLKSSHPASVVYTNIEKWDSGDVFNKVNQLLTKQSKKEIIW